MLDIISPKKAQEILSIQGDDGKTILKEDVSTLPLTEIKVLPSGFKGYPEGTKISYTPLTLGELEALNSSDADLTRGVAMLLNSIRCNTMNPEDLYYWDVMYIGVQRKLLAFGDTHGVIYSTCPVCGNVVQKEFDYTELEFEQVQAPDLPIVVTLAGKELEFSLITIKDFLQVDVTKGELDVYARMVKNLPYEEAYNLLSNCYGKDTKLLRFIDKQLQYGLKPFTVECDNTITVENPDYDPNKKGSKKTKTEKCSEKVIMEVRSPFEVVFPEDSDEIGDEFEIQYGRK